MAKCLYAIKQKTTAAVSKRRISFCDVDSEVNDVAKSCYYAQFMTHSKQWSLM